MARDRTLGEILEDVRIYAGQSISPAHGRQTHDPVVRLIQTEQERLWEDWNWPTLRVKRFINLQTGLRYYAPPQDGGDGKLGSTRGVHIDRVEQIDVMSGGVWKPLRYGIDDPQYNVFDSDTDERSWPVENWAISEDEQIEVWPVPARTGDTVTKEGTLRITGIRNLRRLVQESDRADIDGQLLALYVAGKILARSKSPDANLRMQEAAARYQRLKGNQVKGESIKIGGGSNRYRGRQLRGTPRVAVRQVP